MSLEVPIRPFGLHDHIGPAAAHRRVRQLFGPAKQYECIECGRRAQDWAYDGTDPSQLYGRDSDQNSKVYYSRYPEFYMPMCKSCHLCRDGRLFSTELEQYRTLKMETGLTYEEIRERCLT